MRSPPRVSPNCWSSVGSPTSSSPGYAPSSAARTTARTASDLGYDVRFVLDATATDPLPLWDGSGTLTPAEVKARTASALAGRFAEVVTIEDVLRILTRS